MPRAGVFPWRAVALRLRGPSSPEGVSGVQDDIIMLCRWGRHSGGELQGSRPGG